MNDTLEPTAERLRRTFRAVADQVVDATPAFDAEPMTDTNAEGIVVDIQRSLDRTARNRWLIAAAAVAVAIVVAGTVLLADGGRDAIRTKPATQNSAPPTLTPPTTTLTIPTTVPGDDSTTGPLLPESAPSSPPSGELIATIGIRHRGAYRLYADGRLLFTLFGGNPPAGVSSSWAEQRLTPEGVERVRSRFLSSGLFDSAPPLSNVEDCPGPVTACVRDGDHWLGVAVDHALAGASTAPPEAVRLFDDLVTLDYTLPATAWADQQFKPYTPARIATCMKLFVTDPSQDPSKAVEVPLGDLPVLLQRLPAPVAEFLAGREVDADLTSRLLARLGGEVGQGGCFELTLDEARTLVDTSLSPTGGGTHQYWRLTFALDPQAASAQADSAVIRFEELLPDGGPTTTGD
jgi:hypothetical protein